MGGVLVASAKAGANGNAREPSTTNDNNTFFIFLLLLTNGASSGRCALFWTEEIEAEKDDWKASEDA